MRKTKFIKYLPVVILTATVVACNGGGGGSDNPPDTTVVSYSYITNIGNTDKSDGSITQYGVNKSGQIIPSKCITSLKDSATFNLPMELALNESYIFSVDLADNQILQCNLNESGVLEPQTCVAKTPTGSGKLNKPQSLTVNSKFAFIVNESGNSYTQCNVTVNGIESNTCNTITPTGNGALYQPRSITLNGNYAYIADRESYTQCMVDSNESILPDTCVTSSFGSVKLKSTDLLLSVDVNGKYIYFVAKDNQYIQCSINNSGLDSSSCKLVSPQQLLYPHGLGFSTTGSSAVAYFTTEMKFLVQCAVNTNTGILPNSCGRVYPQAPGQIESSYGIGFTSVF